MTQDRDDFMRREDAYLGMLRKQDLEHNRGLYLQKFGRAFRPMPTQPVSVHEWTLPTIDNDPCDEMVTDDQVFCYISINPVWGDDPHMRAAALLGTNRADAKGRMFHWLYGGRRTKPKACLLDDMHQNLHRGEACPDCGYVPEGV